MTRASGKFAQVAFINESACVGCARCLDVCPVDAIVGARNLMHTVIAAECIGCRLCLRPCPVDCIAMVSTPEDLRPGAPGELIRRQALTRARHRDRKKRLAQEEAARRVRLETKKAALRRGTE